MHVVVCSLEHKYPCDLRQLILKKFWGELLTGQSIHYAAQRGALYLHFGLQSKHSQGPLERAIVCDAPHLL